MNMIADLHIHSRFSRATSKEGNLENLDLWARKKGIALLGTGDFTHPAWREELKEKLMPAEEGLYRLKEEYVLEEARAYEGVSPRFVVTGEISSIYKKNNKVRKVHSLLLLPGLLEAEVFSKKLETIGNIHSDGRPILGLDCKDLLELQLELVPDGIYVPAHIWTPHFSVFGAFSGFGTMEECFEDLTPYIRAVETGLSSDPPMNWRLSALDRYQLISNSDAHSPGKLGREANLLTGELSYPGLYKAIQEGEGLEGTIEFFPEEGKYHYDGHRKCHICLSPAEADQYQGKCPVCGKKMTMGVYHRIKDLADRKEGSIRKNPKKYENLVPLLEVIAAAAGRSAASKTVQQQYEALLRNLGSEFFILRQASIQDIRREAGYLVSEGVRRIRDQEVVCQPGFDGEYGIIQLFEKGELQNLEGQLSLFKKEEMQEKGRSQKLFCLPSSPKAAEALKASPGKFDEPVPQDPYVLGDLNLGQEEAVKAISPDLAVIAGPGTGKTRTLVARILDLLERRRVKPSEITAVTFTNQAAAELKERLAFGLGSSRSLNKMQVGTFHSLCLDYLKRAGASFTLAGEEQTLELAKEIQKAFHLSLSPKRLRQEISLCKTSLKPFDEKERAIPQKAYAYYQDALSQRGLMDFDDLLLETLRLFEDGQEERIGHAGLSSLSYILVDEFQDVSPLQYRLLLEWRRHGRELFVIGDPNQSIYGFRGSDSACFGHLQEDQKNLRVIRLTENYRSCKHILSAAQAVISHNKEGQTDLEAHKEKGSLVRIVEAPSQMAEAIYAAREVNRLIGGIDMLDVEYQETFREEKRTWTFRDIAILYRTHHQARLLEKCLSREGIPYIVIGREDFLSEPVIRGTAAFFRSLAEEEPTSCRQEAETLLWNLGENPMAETIYENMKKKYEKKWLRMKPEKLLESWMEDLDAKEDPSLLKLTSMAVCYKNMGELMDQILLGEERDLKRCGQKHYDGDAVRLMTLHGSKGLEFPVVIIYGADKGGLPLENKSHPSNVEEERRLFYVGMTRAREELVITCTKDASPFLEELPSKGVQKVAHSAAKEKPVFDQMNLFDFL